MLYLRRFDDVSDTEVIHLFGQMEREGVKHSVFYDGFVDTSWDFIEYVRSKLIWGGFIFEGEVPVACVWVAEISGNVAFFHYWTYKAAWGRSNDVALFALTYIAENTHLTGLCGRTPVTLPLAVRALKRRGFRIVGTIPEAITLHDKTITDALVSFYDLKPLKEGN